MAGTTEGGKKAAETRGHEDLAKAGREGGKHSHQNDRRDKDNNQSRDRDSSSSSKSNKDDM